MLFPTNYRPARPATDDFGDGIEGELVTLSISCDDPLGCGCGRSFVGLSSLTATTTALIRDIPLTADEVVTATLGALHSAGWIDSPEGDDDDQYEATGIVADLAATAERFGAGTVIRPVFNSPGRRWDFQRCGTADTYNDHRHCCGDDDSEGEL